MCCVYVCVCVLNTEARPFPIVEECLCVCVRERERGCVCWLNAEAHPFPPIVYVCARKKEMCVCVCVYMRVC